MDQVLHPHPWKLALVIGDDEAMRVLAAWYSLPPWRRVGGKIRELTRLSGIDGSVAAALEKLDAAELLGKEEAPPPVVQQLINAYVAGKLKK